MTVTGVLVTGGGNVFFNYILVAIFFMELVKSQSKRVCTNDGRGHNPNKVR
jgi:hypothetical protein